VAVAIAGVGASAVRVLVGVGTSVGASTVGDGTGVSAGSNGVSVGWGTGVSAGGGGTGVSVGGGGVTSGGEKGGDWYNSCDGVVHSGQSNHVTSNATINQGSHATARPKWLRTAENHADISVIERTLYRDDKQMPNCSNLQQRHRVPLVHTWGTTLANTGA
jgi:hypothetical protein